MTSTAVRLISVSLAFEPIVLISLPISCKRNSSFRPELSGSSMIATYCAKSRAKTNDFLADIRTIGEDRDFPDEVTGFDGHALVQHQRLDPIR